MKIKLFYYELNISFRNTRKDFSNNLGTIEGIREFHKNKTYDPVWNTSSDPRLMTDGSK